MKLFIFLFTFIIFPTVLCSNETEVIELHENKSLDQMVLEQIDDSIQENNISLDINTDNDELESQVEIDGDNIVVETSVVNYNNFFQSSSIEDVNQYLNNAKDVKSHVIQNELFFFLENLNLDYSLKKNKDIFYYLVKYFYDVGKINKAYNLLNSRSIDEDENLEFYFRIELNYFLSTFQLDKACLRKDEISLKIKLDFNLLEKIDIFCLILENNISEAELLNSILLETEKEPDQYFQKLLLILMSKENLNTDTINFKNNNNDLIFLYSAMARIAELPFE